MPAATAVTIMIGPGTTGLWVIIASMSADICDYDEVTTGKRREGSFASIYQRVLKLGSSFAFFWMRVFYAATPATAMLIIFGILLKYPLTEKETQRIREGFW